MKTTKTNLWLIFSFFAIVIGCSDDDSIKVDSSPEFQSIVEEISSLPGQTFIMTAIVSDPAGIKSVNINYEPWFLDKTIIKDSLPESYQLSYEFKVPDEAVENTSHTITITTANSGGNITSKNVVVTLDQDIAAPEIQIASPINGATILIGSGDEINFDVTVRCDVHNRCGRQ